MWAQYSDRTLVTNLEVHNDFGLNCCKNYTQARKGWPGLPQKLLVLRVLKNERTIKRVQLRRVKTIAKFWPCQQNLIKTLQNEAIAPRITKITLKFFWTFSVEVIRPTKINIWWSHFRNNIFFKMKLSKNSFYKSWAPKLIYSNEIFIRKFG